jgi:hypothetical protein
LTRPGVTCLAVADLVEGHKQLILGDGQPTVDQLSIIHEPDAEVAPQQHLQLVEAAEDLDDPFSAVYRADNIALWLALNVDLVVDDGEDVAVLAFGEDPADVDEEEGAVDLLLLLCFAGISVQVVAGLAVASWPRSVIWKCWCANESSILLFFATAEDQIWVDVDYVVVAGRLELLNILSQVHQVLLEDEGASSGVLKGIRFAFCRVQQSTQREAVVVDLKPVEVLTSHRPRQRSKELVADCILRRTLGYFVDGVELG